MAALLTTLETEMSTKAVDQGQVSAEQITQIFSKVYESVGAPEKTEKTDEIDIKVAYQFIKHLEGREMFHKELKPCERYKWANLLMMLPYSKRSFKVFQKILAEFDAFLTKPLLKILGI